MSHEQRAPGEHAHARVEKNVAAMAILIAVAISFGGLAEIVPLMYQAEAIEPLPGVKPYPALQLAGRDIYVREGCYNCHSQMVRTLRFETERYGHYSLAGESVYDRPFQWGSKRTGPDLARVGGRYSDDWHRVHLNNPRDVVPESNMPAYPWLSASQVDGALLQRKLQTLRTLGDPYSDADIAGAPAAVAGMSEQDALIAYLQGLGLHAPGVGVAAAAGSPALPWVRTCANAVDCSDQQPERAAVAAPTTATAATTATAPTALAAPAASTSTGGAQ